MFFVKFLFLLFQKRWGTSKSCPKVKNQMNSSCSKLGNNSPETFASLSPPSSSQLTCWSISHGRPIWWDGLFSFSIGFSEGEEIREGKSTENVRKKLLRTLKGSVMISHWIFRSSLLQRKTVGRDGIVVHARAHTTTCHRPRKKIILFCWISVRRS